jgi:hypothetical protein
LCTVTPPPLCLDPPGVSNVATPEGAVEKRQHFNKEFHEKLLAAGRALFQKPHKVVGVGGEIFDAVGGGEMKGVRGADGRMYALEMTRSTPRDVNFKNKSEAVLRPELVQAYCRLKMTEAARAAVEAGGVGQFYFWG